MYFFSDTFFETIPQYFSSIFQMPQIVAGVDEAGRGALAGPVVAGAVILPRDFPSDFFFDSKILTEKKREEIFEWISANADFGFGEVSAEEIDRIGIKKATNEAMRRAVSALKTTPDLLKIDGNDRFSFSLPSEDFVRGDALYPEISAASIVAKVTRDRKMCAFARDFPGYSFEKNKGYGAKVHLDAIFEKGICAIHRRSYDPVRTLLTQGTLF